LGHIYSIRDNKTEAPSILVVSPGMIVQEKGAGHTKDVAWAKTLR